MILQLLFAILFITAVPVQNGLRQYGLTVEASKNIMLIAVGGLLAANLHSAFSILNWIGYSCTARLAYEWWSQKI